MMFGWWFFWPLLMIFLFWWIASPWGWGWGSGGYRWRREGAWDYAGRPIEPQRAFLPSRTRPGNRGKGPAGYHRSDQRIAEDINDALMMSDEIDATGVLVTVQGGVVLLSGYVPGRADKRLAESLADSVPGVVDVRNDLHIGAAPSAATQVRPDDMGEGRTQSIDHGAH